MISVAFTTSFLRKVKQIEKVNKILFEEISQKIELFRDRSNHRTLKVHKLHGDLKKFFAFSVNYKVRIVFEYIGMNKVVLHGLDDHDVYKR